MICLWSQIGGHTSELETLRKYDVISHGLVVLGVWDFTYVWDCNLCNVALNCTACCFDLYKKCKQHFHQNSVHNSNRNRHLAIHYLQNGTQVQCVRPLGRRLLLN